MQKKDEKKKLKIFIRFYILCILTVKTLLKNNIYD